MSGLIPTMDELKVELQEKAPDYFTDDRLAPMTFSDCVFARTEVNKQLAAGVISPFKPGNIKKPKPEKPRNEEVRPEYTRDETFGIVTEEELAVAKADAKSKIEVEIIKDVTEGVTDAEVGNFNG